MPVRLENKPSEKNFHSLTSQNYFLTAWNSNTPDKKKFLDKVGEKNQNTKKIRPIPK